MTITVQRLIEHLQGFPAGSEIAITDENEKEFFLTRFIPIGGVLKIVISDEEEGEEEE